LHPLKTENMKKLLVLTALVSSVYFSGAQSLSPEVIGSAGDYFTAAGGSIAFTVGEPMTETFSSSGNILTQGFHQPWPVVTGVTTVTGQMNVTVYPNPASQMLTIESTLEWNVRPNSCSTLSGNRCRSV